MQHSWNLSPSEAIELQNAHRSQLVLKWNGRTVTTISGVDVALQRETARAAIVVLRYPELLPLAAATAAVLLTFPYVPGLLSFREAPAILAAWEKLSPKPDLLMFDAQGIAHPRGFGLAAHLGLWLDLPSIGVAKSRLYGDYLEPGPNKGDCAPLLDEEDPDRVIGTVLRTRTDIKCIYVSPGHLIDIPRSAELALECATGFRLPEPTRWAHRVAGGATLPVAAAR